MDCWSTSLQLDDEFKNTIIRLNPPRVVIDNKLSDKTTVVKVDSVNRHGCLLEAVQVLIDMNLLVKRAYISSDGEWFLDVFHVTDQNGNKLPEGDIAERIQQSLGPKVQSCRSVRSSVDCEDVTEQTTLELTGIDRPGLLSEIFAVLTDLKCNVVDGEIWTHISRMASIIHITDDSSGLPIDDPDRIAKIKKLLLCILKGDMDRTSVNTVVSMCSTHVQRRLHQMMYEDRDYDVDDVGCGLSTDSQKAVVTVENCPDKNYTVVNLQCGDRPKLLFDTVCTLTDMQYVVFHANVLAEGPEAYQEYYVRRADGLPISSEVERQRLIHCVEAAINRRTFEGIRLKLCCEDRVGLLSYVTRIFRENSLSVIRAEVSTRGSQAVNIFYVVGASGEMVKNETIETVRKEIGSSILRVEDDTFLKPDPHDSGKVSLGNFFRSISEKFLYNLGLIKSCS